MVKMAREAKKTAKRTEKKKAAKKGPKRPPRTGTQGTLSVLDGAMKDIFREAFLSRP
jgi:hypothetical protein